MGYCIQYDEATGAMEIRRKRRPKKKALIFLLTVIILCAVMIWPTARQGLKKILLPGDEGVTAQALQSLVEDLHQGSSIPEAVDAFCREIIAHE